MSIDLLAAMIDFAQSTEADWNSFDLPIPKGVVIITTDTQVFKRGNGYLRYSALPAGPSIEGIATGGETITNVLAELLIADEDKIIFVDNEMYDASTSSIADILTRIANIQNTDAIQDANLDTVESQANSIDPDIDLTDDGKLVIVTNGKMSPGITVNSLVEESTGTTGSIHVKNFGVYTDYNCTMPAITLATKSTFYAKLDIMHDIADINDITINVTSPNTLLTITKISTEIFRIVVGNLTTFDPITITGTASYNTDIVTRSITFQVDEFDRILVDIYGALNYDDNAVAMATDSAGNIYVIGDQAASTPSGAFIAKFDSNFNLIIKRYYYSSSTLLRLKDIAIDNNGNIYAVGASFYNGWPDYAVIMKFDSALTLIYQKYYGAWQYGPEFYRIAIDSNGNVFTVGTRISHIDDSPYIRYSIVIKWSSTLTVITKIRIPISMPLSCLAIDSSNNIYIAGGYEYSGVDCLGLMKLDNNLNTLSTRCYSTTSTYTYSAIDIKINSLGQIFILSGTLYNDGICIIKLNSSLALIASKIFYNVSYNMYYTIPRMKLMSSGDILISARSDGSGYNGALLITLDSTFVKRYSKLIGQNDYSSSHTYIDVDTINSDQTIIVMIDLHDSVTLKEDILLVKLDDQFPAGTFLSSATNVGLKDVPLTSLDWTPVERVITVSTEADDRSYGGASYSEGSISWRRISDVLV